jgi:pyruvate kinase
MKIMIDYYGTLGPSCADEDTLRRMFDAGMTGARLNLSHGTLTQNGSWVRSFAAAFAASKQAAVLPAPRLIIDLQGPELRIGNMAPLQLDEGESVLLGTDIPAPQLLLDALQAGEQLALDDSAILLQAEEKSISGWRCRILRGGRLNSRKSVALLGRELPSPALTAEDLYNLDHAAEYGVTDLLQPFVRGKDDIAQVRAALDVRGLTAVRIIAKIESLTGVEKLDEIMEAADEICIARGDLGNAMPLWLLPGLQRKISLACRAAGKPFMVVTQMLHSMLHSAVPTRAEVSDIYHAVLSGASSVMLTGETAAGDYPVQAMEYLVRTGREAEKDR